MHYMMYINWEVLVELNNNWYKYLITNWSKQVCQFWNLDLISIQAFKHSCVGMENYVFWHVNDMSIIQERMMQTNHGYDKWTFQGKLTIEVQLGQWIMYITFNEGNGVVKQLGINRLRNSCDNYKTYHKCTLN
jgi:hypothetical protein